MQICRYSVTTYLRIHFVTSIGVSAYSLSKNPLNNCYCVPAIHFVIHLKQCIKHTVCLFDVLKATEGKRKKKEYKRDNGVSTYSALLGIQLRRGRVLCGCSYDQNNIHLVE